MTLDKDPRGSLDRASSRIETEELDVDKLISALDANGYDISNAGNVDVNKLIVG